MIRRPPKSPLFPYTTLSRSCYTRRSRGEPAPPRRSPRPSKSLCALAYDPYSPSREQPPSSAPQHILKQNSLRSAEQPKYGRSEEHTSELQSRQYLVCRLLLE